MDLNLAIGLLGLVTLLLGFFGQMVQKNVGGEPLLALITGFLVGPYALDLIAPEAWGHRVEMMEQLARFTIALGLMEIGLSLPRPLGRSLQRSLALRLLVILPMMWFTSTLVFHSSIGMSLIVALLAGAIVAPTDPIVSSAIVTGHLAKENLPKRMRESLSLEAGANDGLAWLFVMLPIFLLHPPAEGAWWHWLQHSLLQEVIGGAIYGAVLGAGAGFLMRWGEKIGEFPEGAFVTFSMILAVVVLTVSRFLGGDGLLSVFIAALVFARVVREDKTEDRRLRYAVNRFFMIPVFVILGAILPLDQWKELGWDGVAAAAGILVLRRLPVILLTRPLSPLLKTWREAAMVGWFGPIGIAAIFYATVAEKLTGNDELWVLTTLIVVASVIVHGVTAPIFVRMFGAEEGQRERD